MSMPQFIHVQLNGDIFYSLDPNYTAPGTNVAIFRVYAGAQTQKLGTVSGNSGAYACSGGTGKFGKEIV